MSDQILTAGEVAHMFGVHPKTVAKWSLAGRLPYFWTLGGHRRYRREDIERVAGEWSEDRTEPKTY
jgi:excisionase family DNA binding protein